MKKLFCLTIILLFMLAGCAPATPTVSSEALPEMNRLFYRESGWTGGDAIESIPLASDKILWLFGDSYFSDIKNGARVCLLCFAHNSIAIQQNNSVSFSFGPTQGSRSSPFFSPPDGKGWFWPGHGIRTTNGLVIFLWQFAPDNNPQYVFGKPVATWQAIISNPDDAPSSWKISFQKLPGFQQSDGLIESFGTSVMKDGDWIYIYGFREVMQPSGPTRSMLIARTAPDTLMQFDKWQFYANGQWQNDEAQAEAGIVIAPDYSVSRVAALSQYAAIYTEAGLSSKIMMRLSSTPVGPWSEPQLIYQCPEAEQDQKVECYAARAHPELPASPNELIITYATNESGNLSKPQLYFPRFVLIRISD